MLREVRRENSRPGDHEREPDIQAATSEPSRCLRAKSIRF